MQYNKLMNHLRDFSTGFATGGLVDFTGPAYVHGSKLRPEAFLSAEDTAMIREWLDEAKYANYRATVSNIDGSMFGTSGFNTGDIYVNITEASLNNDDDIEAVAEKVGQAFVRQISKQGLMTANYAFG